MRSAIDTHLEIIREWNCIDIFSHERGSVSNERHHCHNRLAFACVFSRGFSFDWKPKRSTFLARSLYWILKALKTPFRLVRINFRRFVSKDRAAGVKSFSIPRNNAILSWNIECWMALVFYIRFVLYYYMYIHIYSDLI